MRALCRFLPAATHAITEALTLRRGLGLGLRVRGGRPHFRSCRTDGDGCSWGLPKKRWRATALPKTLDFWSAAALCRFLPSIQSSHGNSAMDTSVGHAIPQTAVEGHRAPKTPPFWSAELSAAFSPPAFHAAQLGDSPTRMSLVEWKLTLCQKPPSLNQYQTFPTANALVLSTQ
jgi:hypothetical protein